MTAPSAAARSVAAESAAAESAVESPTPKDTAAVRAWSQPIMGLPFSIHLRRPFSDPAAERAVDALFAELRQADAVYSPYLADSELCRRERGELPAGSGDPSWPEVLALVQSARNATGGGFDADAGGRFDPSGAVKGWAAERAARHLGELDADFYLNAGGDVLVHTAGPAGSAPPWRIGIEHPSDPQTMLAVVALTGGAVATSGTTHRGAHILDPATGAAARGVVQATVIGPTLTWSDILATAVVAGGRALPDTANWPAGYDVLLVTDEGLLAATPGIHTRLDPAVTAPTAHFRLPPPSSSIRV